MIPGVETILFTFPGHCTTWEEGWTTVVEATTVPTEERQCRIPNGSSTQIGAVPSVILMLRPPQHVIDLLIHETEVTSQIPLLQRYAQDNNGHSEPSIKGPNI